MHRSVLGEGKGPGGQLVVVVLCLVHGKRERMQLVFPTGGLLHMLGCPLQVVLSAMQAGGARSGLKEQGAELGLKVRLDAYGLFGVEVLEAHRQNCSICHHMLQQPSCTAQAVCHGAHGRAVQHAPGSSVVLQAEQCPLQLPMLSFPLCQLYQVSDSTFAMQLLLYKRLCAVRRALLKNIGHFEPHSSVKLEMQNAS